MFRPVLLALLYGLLRFFILKNKKKYLAETGSLDMGKGKDVLREERKAQWQ